MQPSRFSRVRSDNRMRRSRASLTLPLILAHSWREGARSGGRAARAWAISARFYFLDPDGVEYEVVSDSLSG